MPTYPFTRAKPAGWAFGEIFTSAQCNIVDANGAQAADGLFWTDIAAFRNWPSSNNISGARTIVQGIRSSTTPLPLWMVAGTSDLERRSPDGRIWYGSTVASFPTTPLASAASSDGLNVVVGGDNGASTQKYSYTTTGVAPGSFAAGTSADGTAATVNTICRIAGSVNLFVAGLSDGGIETSPTGQTWTDRTVPNANARTTIATNGTNLLAAVTSASTDKYITSTDGVTWTERSFPVSSTAWQIAYSSYAGKWFASCSPGSLYKSSDAISWSAVATNYTLLAGPLVAVGRVLLMANGAILDGINIGIIASVDEGTTWFRCASVAGTAGVVYAFVRGFHSNQVAIVTDSANVSLSVPMADPTDATYL